MTKTRKNLKNKKRKVKTHKRKTMRGGKTRRGKSMRSDKTRRGKSMRGGKTRRGKSMRGGKTRRKKRQNKRYLRRKYIMRGGNCENCGCGSPEPSMQGGAKIPMYSYNKKPFLPDLNSNCLPAPTPYKGGKRGKHSQKKNKQYRQRGGGFLSDIPGYTDFRDLWWKSGETVKGLYNQYNGYKWGANTSSGVQPVGDRVMNNPNPLNLPKIIQNSSIEASKYTPLSN